MIGWIALYRSITEHWVWHTSSRRLQRWIDLLFLASWKERDVGFGNIIVHLERGQIVTSIRQLMARWRTNNSTVTATLKLFEDNGMISCKRGRNMTIITVVNYDKYQRFAALAQSLADEQQLFGETEATKSIIPTDNLSKKGTDERHMQVHFQIPIEEEINNNIQKPMVDVDARAKEIFDEFSSPLKIEQGCMSLRISKDEYFEILNEVISDWKFSNETDWSARHMLNHLRRKVVERRAASKKQDNGRISGIIKEDDRSDDGESPFARATTSTAD